MTRRSLCLFPLLVLLACPNAAWADSESSSRAVENVSAKGFDQIVYKGLVGNALDGIPMNPSKRVSLQRTNAIVSNTLSGRTLAVLAGLTNPALLIGGFVWGVWAASNIKPEEDGLLAVSDPSLSGADAATREVQLALMAGAPGAEGPHLKHSTDPVSARLTYAADAEDAAQLRPAVVKVWLPQRSTVATSAR
jgi:hypothetical protein